MGGDGVEAFLLAQIPNLDRVVVTSRGNLIAVGRKIYSQHLKNRMLCLCYVLLCCVVLRAKSFI